MTHRTFCWCYYLLLLFYLHIFSALYTALCVMWRILSLFAIRATNSVSWLKRENIITRKKHIAHSHPSTHTHIHIQLRSTATCCVLHCIDIHIVFHHSITKKLRERKIFSFRMCMATQALKNPLENCRAATKTCHLLITDTMNNFCKSNFCCCYFLMRKPGIHQQNFFSIFCHCCLKRVFFFIYLYGYYYWSIYLCLVVTVRSMHLKFKKNV